MDKEPGLGTQAGTGRMKRTLKELAATLHVRAFTARWCAMAVACRARRLSAGLHGSACAQGPKGQGAQPMHPRAHPRTLPRALQVTSSVAASMAVAQPRLLLAPADSIKPRLQHLAKLLKVRRACARLLHGCCCA